MDDEKVHRAIATYDAAHPYWRQEREAREGKEAEEPAQRAQDAKRQAAQQLAANNTKAWCDWVDQRIEATLADRPFSDLQRDVLGQVIFDERAGQRKEIKTAAEEAHRATEAKLEAQERRVIQRVFERTRCIEQVTERTSTLWNMIATERQDRQKEIKTFVDAAQNRFEAGKEP